MNGEMQVLYGGGEGRGENEVAPRRLVRPEVVVDCYVDYLGRTAIENGQGL